MNREERADILYTLERMPGILRKLVNDAPDSRIDWRPREVIWTIKEHLHHLAVTHMMLAKRIKLFIAEEHPTVVPFVPSGAPSGAPNGAPGGDGAADPSAKSTDELLASIEKYRSLQLEDLRSAGDEVWNRNAHHPEYTEYSFAILARHIMLHDFFHIYRIEELAFLKEDQIKDL